VNVASEHEDRRIYHILGRAGWERARARGAHEPLSLETEGFIHCSTAEQVAGVAEAFDAGRPDLLLLHLDVMRIAPDIRYEGEPEAFPHIYGPLDIAAVLHVQRYTAGEDGRFAAPDPWDTASLVTDLEEDNNGCY
jgi:uncharacterized protein (DUF952 family)